MLYRLYLAAMPFNGNSGRTQARKTCNGCTEKVRTLCEASKITTNTVVIEPLLPGYVYDLNAVVFEEIVPDPQSARRSSRISDLSFVPSSDERSCGCINISL
ncbi:unnamed protein product [Arctogadus glacialis]